MKEVRIRAVGDNLIHKQLYQAARLESGGYCFDSMFENVKELISEADIAVINQETIMVADGGRVSSFPAFGSPMEVGDAIAAAGFQVVTHASNHALDKGVGAIRETCSFWKKTYPDIQYIGIHDNKTDQRKIAILEKNGIRIAMLNFTEKLNYHMIPPGKSYCVEVMKSYRKKIIREQLQAARKMADVVIVFPHWGCEYLYEPVKSQKKWSAFFAENGADLIIGTHPHVLQNCETIFTADGRRVSCLYSLGNFISCQVKAGTMLGGMADVMIQKEEGKVAVVSAKILPLVTHTDSTYSFFTTYPLAKYTDELAAENKIFQIVNRQYGIKVDCAYLKTLFKRIGKKEAQEDNEFQCPMDVTRSNIRGVFCALTGKNTKE